MTLTFLSQFDGGPLASKNCSSTCAAMQVAFESGGLHRPTGSQFRAHVKNASGTPDVTGGINVSQAVATARSTY